jgi:excisionase family DNA binding protein
MERAAAQAAKTDESESPQQPGSPEPPEVMNVIEAAAFLHVAPATVRTALAGQRLPGKRVGKEWRLSRTALMQWLSEPGKAKNYPKRGTRKA